MKSHPILMSGPMVMALLREAKTPGTGKSMTRRLAYRGPFAPNDKRLKVRQEVAIDEESGDVWLPTPWLKMHDRFEAAKARGEADYRELLYVREAGGIAQRGDSTPGGKPYDPWYVYRATESEPDFPEPAIIEPFRWRPSIHMPKWASRLTLVVTATKVEPLQDIRTGEIRAEGVTETKFWNPENRTNTPKIDYYLRPSFERLWNSINGPDAWAANPPVVALTFAVHKRNVADMEREAS